MKSLEPDTPEHLYQQLATRLASEIKAQRHRPGCKLPSIRELADLHGVSDITVRRALEELRQAEIVYSVQGKGYFVTERVISKTMPTVDGFSDSVEREGLTASSIVIRAELQAARSELTNRLGIDPHSEVVLLERVRLADGVPLCIQVSYLPHSLCPGVLEHDFSTLSLYRVLRQEYQIRMGKSRYTVQAALAEDRELHYLKLHAPAAVLWVTHWAYTPSGMLYEYGKTAYRADRYRVTSNLTECELIPDTGS
jgi:GntR family transcriptional regulator